MKSYIKESAKKIKSLKEIYFFGKPVFLLKPFNNSISLETVLNKIESIIPDFLTNNFEVVYVGDFTSFHRKGRVFNAMYKDSALYISNIQDNEEDLIDDLIHEIAHSFEKEYDENIYGDNAVEEEFLGKRKRLYYLVDKPTTSMLYYLSPDYQPEFDEHLYDDLGYDYLRVLASGLFYSPYAITSLREYWANGFENYLIGDRQKLKDLSPILYTKIKQILEIDEENKNEH
jgi:hypothetical protein